MFKNLKYIVTGTGRCGTVYMARLLTAHGIPCGHESVFNLSLVDYRSRLTDGDYRMSVCSNYDTLTKKNLPKWLNVKDIEADSSYMSAPYLMDYRVNEVPLIHVTRNPLAVISSFILDGMFFTYKEAEIKPNTDLHLHLTKHVVPYEEFMTRHVPELREPNLPITRACIYYINWINMIEKANDGRPFYRHHVEDGPEALFQFLGVERSESYEDRLYNSWKKRMRDFRLYDIPKSIRDKFVEAADKAGYTL